MNIGSVFLTLLADGSKLAPQVQQEAAKAGDAGAKTLGQRLSGGLKGEAFKVLGGVASAAFGLMTKGALELENVQARIRAETSATADEAAAAAKVVNKVAGDERMSLEAVSDIAIRVRRDIGAIGPEADKLTAKIAKFARVTRQEGGAAVADIDDLMDAWGLTVDDLDGLLDKLVVSGKKFGGTITADQKALAAMAPQLKAFNLNIDDGIALLDLFKASGLDAAGIPRALNSAIQKLDGRPLQDFIAELAAIEDPGERARRAIEVFGARAGAQLANAIKPGMDSLEDFKISTEEAAGAVDAAADVLDSTWSGRLSKFFSQVGAAARGFGADLGAATTALASLGTLLATMGGGKLLKGLAAVTLKPLAGLGVRIATFIATELATSTVASRLSDGLASGFSKVPGSSAMKSGINRLGAALGSPLGKAIGLAAAIAFVVWFADELNKRKDEVAAQAKTIGDSVGEQIKNGTDAQLEQSLAALREGMAAIEAATKRGPIQMATPEQIDALKALVEQYNIVQEELNRRAAINAGVAESQLRGAKSGVASAAAELAMEIPNGFTRNQAAAAGRMQAFLDMTIGQRLVAMGPVVLRRAAELALGIASGLRDRRSAIDAAMDQLREDIKNRLTPSKEVAHDIGLLFSKTLARGLKDADPVIKAQAEGTRALIEAQLIETIKAGGEAGKKIQEELEAKLKSKDPAVKAQAERTKSLVDAALKAQPAKTPGEVIGDQLNADLKDKGTTLGRTAYDLGRTIAKNLMAGVKGTGYVAPSPSPTGRHYSGPQEFHKGTWGVQGDQLAFVHDREIIVPEAESEAIRAGTATLGAVPTGPIIGSLSLSVDARGNPNPDATGAAVKQGVADAMADVFRDQSLRGLTGTRP
jgi:antitoxin component HigA of HigAB toxin-antitoxin module